MHTHWRQMYVFRLWRTWRQKLCVKMQICTHTRLQNAYVSCLNKHTNWNSMQIYIYTRIPNWNCNTFPVCSKHEDKQHAKVHRIIFLTRRACVHTHAQLLCTHELNADAEWIIGSLDSYNYTFKSIIKIHADGK